jgi:predicted transposase/invertase (TIGR01784 family)
MGINTNREYKSSVFTSLFGEKDNLLELYNAIQNTNYGKDTKIEITTIEDVIFKERVNDISFLIDGKIVVLIEHQSTINENMPLRLLLYMARIYEKITDNKDLYRKNRITIARPEFIVLYNGIDEYPDKKTLMLSEMFARYGKESPVNLELTVQIYNINKGRNPEIAKKCETLDGYEIFVAAVREYEKTMGRDEAIKLAVDDCVNRNILKKFLEDNSSEVRNMLLTEWNWDTALEISKEEGMQQGMQKGMQKVLDVLQQEGYDIKSIKNKLPHSFAQ